MELRRPPRSPPINSGLLQLIRAKREWHWKPSFEELRRGFRGWHERGYLPHFDAPNVTQMVTFMLDDSFPITRRIEWEPILREPDDSVKRRKLEAWLDRGHGECWLRRADVVEVVERELLEDDGAHFKQSVCGHRQTLGKTDLVALVADIFRPPGEEVFQIVLVLDCFCSVGFRVFSPFRGSRISTCFCDGSRNGL